MSLLMAFSLILEKQALEGDAGVCAGGQDLQIINTRQTTDGGCHSSL